MRFEKSDADFTIVIMLSRLGMMIVDQLHCAAQMLEGGEEIGGDVFHSGLPCGQSAAIVWRCFCARVRRGTTLPLIVLDTPLRRPAGIASSVSPGPVTPVCQRCLRRTRAAVGVTYSTLSLMLQRRWPTAITVPPNVFGIGAWEASQSSPGKTSPPQRLQNTWPLPSAAARSQTASRSRAEVIAPPPASFPPIASARKPSNKPWQSPNRG